MKTLPSGCVCVDDESPRGRNLEEAEILTGERYITELNQAVLRLPQAISGNGLLQHLQIRK